MYPLAYIFFIEIHLFYSINQIPLPSEVTSYDTNHFQPKCDWNEIKCYIFHELVKVKFQAKIVINFAPLLPSVIKYKNEKADI